MIASEMEPLLDACTRLYMHESRPAQASDAASGSVPCAGRRRRRRSKRPGYAPIDSPTLPHSISYLASILGA